ncbi:MAG: ABC transporter ATP-binding protein [Deltaproteobacteria bacterium]|nr:ABC transporter ATP-binding protein [Deltaproteobacteria bacterium]MBW2085225.1 ABC transporter ATP-binding protein [Deltaproteobacteria bacterium]
MIQIIDLHKSFGDVSVLKGLNLNIAQGKITFVIGRSGGGKSVLIKLIIGLLKPDRGQILIEGQDIAPLGEHSLNRIRQRFGMLFQNAALFDSLTIEGNIAFPLQTHTRLKEREIKELVQQKMAMVGLKDVENKMPTEISGGMRKRTGLARAIILEPEILLFDEPTTGLDPIMAEVIDDLIIQTQERTNVTSIVISHDIPATLRTAHKVAMIYEGQIVVYGTPEEIQASDNPVVQQFLKGEGEGPMILGD